MFGQRYGVAGTSPVIPPRYQLPKAQPYRVTVEQASDDEDEGDGSSDLDSTPASLTTTQTTSDGSTLHSFPSPAPSQIPIPITPSVRGKPISIVPVNSADLTQNHQAYDQSVLPQPQMNNNAMYGAFYGQQQQMPMAGTPMMGTGYGQQMGGPQLGTPFIQPGQIPGFVVTPIMGGGMMLPQQAGPVQMSAPAGYIPVPNRGPITSGGPRGKDGPDDSLKLDKWMPGRFCMCYNSNTQNHFGCLH